jgi:hypothetical protein
MKRSISRRRVSSSRARSKAEGRTCRERARRERKRDEPAAVSGHPKSSSEQRLRRGRAERHDDLRFDDVDLGLEPGKAGLDFDRARFAVNAPRPRGTHLKYLTTLVT